MIIKRLALKYWSIVKTAGINWNNNDPFRQSAVIAFYTIFSLPGLLVIIINLAGIFLGQEALTHKIYNSTHEYIGDDVAIFIEKIISNSSTNKNLSISNLISICTMIYGATGVFYQIHISFNITWNILKNEKKKGFLILLKDRLFSFGMILVVGFLLLVSLIVSTVLSGMQDVIKKLIGTDIIYVFQLIDIVVSLSLITLLFAALFKYLPDNKNIKWKDVWLGAFITSILFVTAKLLLSYYFKISDPASTYGAAGSIIALMLWVSYSSMILLFGAEFTYAHKQYKLANE